MFPAVWYDGRSVMLGGFFFFHPKALRILLYSIMNSIKYQKIVNENLTASSRTLQLGHGWIFQEDNDLKHTSKSTQNWFSDQKNQALTWPFQSPDLNPVENLGVELKWGVHTRDPRAMEILKRFCI